MSEPASQKLASTTTPTPRKRRRPALSCEQCRRRKIKCDRNYPCGQCTQSKTASCTYAPDSVLATHSHVSKSTGTRTSHDFASIPSRAKPASSTTSGSQLSNTNSSPNADTSQGTGPSPPADDDCDLAPAAKNLLNRVLTLEKKLVDANGVSQSSFGLVERVDFGLAFEAKDSSEDKVRGTVSKTRFFGQSHWMYSFGTVSSYTSSFPQ